MAAFSRLAAALIGAPLELPAELLARFPELRAARFRRGGIFVRIGGWCLGTATVAGVTLWRTVWLAPRARLEPALLLHELRHVHHFAESRLFPVRYMWESLWRGYHRNRYEVDANAFAARRLREAGSSPPSTAP